MFTKFNAKLNTIFLDPNHLIHHNSINGEKVNVILSPSLYWVKKISLPVKYVRDAKKLLASLFEETLPEGNYSYSVYKKGDDFFIFAYEDRLILETLSHSGISLSNVANVHFAQSELQDIEGAIKINESQSIYVKDDIVILVPCCWIEESGDLNLSGIMLSKHKILLQQYAHIVDNSSLYKVGAVLLVLSILIFSEYVITLQKITEISKLKEELFLKYKLKPTTFQNRSMLNKYKSIHKKQTRLREYTSYMLSIKLQGKEKLSKLSLKNKTLNVEFSDATKTTMTKVQSKLKSKNVKYSAEMKDTTMHLEMAL